MIIFITLLRTVNDFFECRYVFAKSISTLFGSTNQRLRLAVDEGLFDFNVICIFKSCQVRTEVSVGQF